MFGTQAPSRASLDRGGRGRPPLTLMVVYNPIFQPVEFLVKVKQ